MSLQTQYGKFENNIKLTRESSEYTAAKEKDDIVKPKITKAFNDEGYEVVKTFLQGSLASFTGIKPLDGDYDIDRGIVIKEASSPDNPVDAKKIVKQVLNNHGFKEPKIKKPCITADYKSAPIHIDYVVYRDIPNKYLELAVGKEYSSESERYWDEGDPEGLKDWLTWKGEFKTDAERKQFYRLVRFLKRWRDVKYVDESKRKKVFSIGLSIMVREQIDFCIDDYGVPDDHKSLINTIKNILVDFRYFSPAGNDDYSLAVLLPKNPNRDVFESSGLGTATLLRNRLNNLLTKLEQIDLHAPLSEQCDLLRLLFGNDFPQYNGSENARDKTEQAGITHVSSGA